MDGQAMDREAFENVWKRVRGGPGEERAPVKDGQTAALEALLRGGLRSAAFLDALAARSAGPVRAEALRTVAREKERLRALQREFFLRTGDSLPASFPSAALPGENAGVFAALRRAVLDARERAAACVRAEAAAEDETLRALYRAYGQELTERAAVFVALIDRLLR